FPDGGPGPVMSSAARQFNPGKRMIARVFATAHLAVHAGRGETLRQGLAEQQMIDAETGVASKGIPEILPEHVDPLTRMQRPQRVGPALPDKRAIGLAYLGPEQRIIDPSGRPGKRPLRVDHPLGARTDT